MQIADTHYPLSTKALVTAAGVRLVYTELGEGFPLIFLHGLGSYLPAWQKNLPYLKQHFRCLALDLPGYGKSSKTGFTAGMGAYAEVVSEFLQILGIDQCLLVGHSMGGQVAIHTALRYPQKIQKIALLAPAGLETFSPAEGQQLQEWFSMPKLIAAPLETVEKNVRANFYAFPDDARVLLQDRLRYTRCSDYPLFCNTLTACVAAMLLEPVSIRLQQLQMPVLLLFGLQDRYIPSPLLHPQLSVEHLVTAAARHIPHAEVSFLNHCGHFIQWEQADLVNELLLIFFCNEATSTDASEATTTPVKE